MIHDCGISENYLVMSLTSLKCNTDRLRKGGNHWAWDPNEDQWCGVVPRMNCGPDDILWFRSDNCECRRNLHLLASRIGRSLPRPHSLVL
jgi:carotenoid cleavage dioxygenase